MRLLNKKQAKNAVEIENQRKVRQGMKIAKKIDELAIKYQSRKDQYEKEHERRMSEMSSEILLLQEKKTQLQREVKTLEKKLNK